LCIGKKGMVRNMESNNNISGIMDTTLEKIKNMVDVNTIVGDPIISSDNTLIVPISKVTFGFFSGGGEMDASTKKPTKVQEEMVKNDSYPFAGGAGAGVTLQPIGFIVASGSNITMLPVNYNSTIERIVETLPNTITQLKDAIKK